MSFKDIISKYWTPHDGQKEVLKAVFTGVDGILKKLIYVSCGRKWGKTEFGVFLCWLYAITRKNAEIYYLAESDEHARELVWANNRMQTCNTYLYSFVEQAEKCLGGKITCKDSEMRVVFPNGSFIKCDGSSRYNSHRGYKPDLIVADEYRDFKEEWYDAIKPNLFVKKNSIIVFTTTPPEIPNHAYKMEQRCEKDPYDDAYHMKQHTIKNTKIPGLKEEIEKERKILMAEGKHDVYRREYCAEFVPGGESALIPQFTNNTLVDYHDFMNIDFSSKHGELVISFSVNEKNKLCVLFGFYDRKNANIYILDSFISKKPTESSLSKCFNALNTTAKLLTGIKLKKWLWIFNKNDERMEKLATDMYNITTHICPKDLKHTKTGIGLIKELLDRNKLFISDKAIDLLYENFKTAQAYRLEKKYTNIDTPLITNLKMILEASDYTIETIQNEPKKSPDIEYMEKLGNLIPAEQFFNKIRMDKWGLTPLDEMWPEIY
jgi:hypothetical protein